MNDTTKNQCPISPADKRLIDGLHLWIETKKSYFEPEQFRMRLNNTIQTLRSITFVLQNYKSSLQGFDKWYSNWQNKMRSDVILRWLVESRNRIVKQGDLLIHSRLCLSVIENWGYAPVFQIEVEPQLKTSEFAHALSDKVPTNIRLDVGLLKVERRWVDVKLPDYELLDALAHSFHLLSVLLYDAHVSLLGSDHKCYCASLQLGVGLPPCMKAGDWDRSMWVDLKRGGMLIPTERAGRNSPEDMKRAANRYNLSESIREKLRCSKSLREEAEVVFEQSKAVLSKDGYHVPIAFLECSERALIVQMNFENNTEKHLAFQNLAAQVSISGATSVILIGEMWKARMKKEGPFVSAENAPEREELLCVQALNNEGEYVMYSVAFRKDEGNNVNFGDESFTKEGVPNSLRPICDVWGLDFPPKGHN